MIKMLTLMLLGNPPSAGAVALGTAVAIFLATLAFCFAGVRRRPSPLDTDEFIEQLRALNSRRSAARSGEAARVALDDDLNIFTGSGTFQSVDGFADDGDRWDESNSFHDFALNEFGDPNIGFRSMDERLD